MSYIPPNIIIPEDENNKNNKINDNISNNVNSYSKRTQEKEKKIILKSKKIVMLIKIFS